MGLHDLKRSHYKCVSNLTRGIATPSTNGTECSASKDTPVMSLRGWLKPDEAISAGRYQIATHLSDARKDTWSVIARSLATSSLPFMSLRGWLKPDEAISAGRYQIATHLSRARKGKKGRPRNDTNDVGGDKPHPYKLTY